MLIGIDMHTIVSFSGIAYMVILYKNESIEMTPNTLLYFFLIIYHHNEFVQILVHFLSQFIL